MSDHIKRRGAGLTADIQSQASQDILDRLDPGSTRARDIWLGGMLGRPRGCVCCQPPAVYRPPQFLPKLLPRDDVEKLSLMLMELKALNDEYEGEPARAATIMLSGTQEGRSLRDRLIEWSRRYVSLRLQKRNPRDNGDPIRTHDRLLYELVPWLEQLAFGEDEEAPLVTTHSAVLADVVDYIPWLIYKGTWAGLVECLHDLEDVKFRVSGRDITRLRHLQQVVGMYHWEREDGLRWFIEAVPSPPSGESIGDIKVRLAMLAENIMEMRPFLLRNFQASKTISEHAPGRWIGWAWSTDGRLINVIVGLSERGVIERLNTYTYHLGARVDLDGIFVNIALSWLTLETQDLPAHAWAVNLELLEKIHDQMLTWFEKIDIEAILSVWRPAEKDTEESVAEDDEVLAASLMRLAQDDDDPDSGFVDQVPQRRRMALRSSRLFSLLEHTLGCEVRQGKGSEICVYRSGANARIFTLGHHKRNDRVSWPVIKRLLKRVGISLDEWLLAIR